MVNAIDIRSWEKILTGTSRRGRERTYEERLIRETFIPRETWTPADEMLYGAKDPLDIPADRAISQRFEAIKHAFNYHYWNNLYYHNLCLKEGISPDDIREEADFVKIPKIEDAFFKSYSSIESKDLYEWLKKISTADLPELDFNDNHHSIDTLLNMVEKAVNGAILHSSGTSGKFSIMFRDSVSMKRWSYVLGNFALYGITHPLPDAHAIYLGPSKTHMAFGRISMEFPKLFDSANVHYLINRPLTMKMMKVGLGLEKGFKAGLELRLIRYGSARARSRIVRLLKQLDSKNKQIFLVGAPYDIYQVMQELRREGKKLNLGASDSVVITASGWKIWESARISEEAFRDEVEEVLGVPESKCRDIYGMSEWNGIAWECEGHYKHIIQCTYPMVLGENMESLGYGEYGRFAFLDPLSNTWPGFIVTADRVKLFSRCPVCHRSGPVLEPEITRMPFSEARGCGNLMRTLMAEDIANTAKAK